MLRMVQVLAVVLAMLTPGAEAAELVSMTLCPDGDFDASARECSPGKALGGPRIVIDSLAIQSLYFLTTVKTTESEEIYHVWISAGKRAGKVAVYDSRTRALRDAEKADLEWLKARNIEGAHLISKLTVPAAPHYRTRSSKAFNPRLAGPWKVQIYDSTNPAPLGEMSFAVALPDRGISNE